MSKSFWAIVLVFSALITAWAGLFVYNELQPKEPMSVPLTPVQPMPEAAVPVEPSTDTAGADSEEGKTTVIEEPASTEKPNFSKNGKKSDAGKQKSSSKSAAGKPSAAGGKQTVVIELTQPDAKRVFVVGDFNKWFRQPMKREGNDWKATMKLLPGTYQYVFVVDDGQKGSLGKRLIDPNQPHSKDGKLSILTVSSEN